MKSSLDPPGRTGFANHGKHAMKHANHGKHTNQGKRTGKRRIIVIFLLGVSLIATLFFNNYEMQDVPSHTQSANGAKERDSERDSERDFHTSEKGEESEREHLVFIGDSTMRYSFLEFVDREHYRNNPDRLPQGLPPVELVHEKYHKSWTSFFRYTTEHFEGHMACDCQRSETFSLANEIENRYYTNPYNNHSYTYIQMYGDNQGHGRYKPDAVYNATISLPADDEDYDPKANENLRKVWAYVGEDMDQLILQYVSKLEPKPTAIIMNAGLWPNKMISFNMEKIMRAAHNVTGVSSYVVVSSSPHQKYVTIILTHIFRSLIYIYIYIIYIYIYA